MICYLVVWSGDVSIVRVAVNACKYLKICKGGLELWDCWKCMFVVWVFVVGLSEILVEL